MPSKIPVTKTFNGTEWLMFDESDVRKACAAAGCDQEMIEDCIAEMKTGGNDCTTCYVYLMDDIKKMPDHVEAAKTQWKTQDCRSTRNE